MKESFRSRPDVNVLLASDLMSQTLGIKEPYLYKKDPKQGFLLCLSNSPVILNVEDLLKDLEQKSQQEVKRKIVDLEANIKFIASENTPFRHVGPLIPNVRSAFTDMVELKKFLPGLEILFPYSIKKLSPGICVSYEYTIEGVGKDKITFVATKYLPPSFGELPEHTNIQILLQHPHSKKLHCHNITWEKKTS